MVAAAARLLDAVRLDGPRQRDAGHRLLLIADAQVLRGLDSLVPDSIHACAVSPGEGVKEVAVHDHPHT
jgi:hypothetical protein